MRFRAELERLERPLDRDADPVHVTASAIVFGERGVVLHLHKRLGIWLQPGGHVDPGETPLAAVLREAREETGLAVRLHSRSLFHVDVHPAAQGHTHLDLRYLVWAPPDEPAPGPDESQDVRWFGLDEAIAIADPGLVGALMKLSSRRAPAGSPPVPRRRS